MEWVGDLEVEVALSKKAEILQPDMAQTTSTAFSPHSPLTSPHSRLPRQRTKKAHGLACPWAKWVFGARSFERGSIGITCRVSPAWATRPPPVSRRC